ncbi:hypothetical protein LCGC14_0464380 [marine sediment metagenome]|uniref:Glycosyltransferase RgtA/B/C/D-like domain-containing protein n=1 Tax=marine sediment metagenome TaxID=412755 RepID=A0A0F9V0N5_9ZZZZ
MDRKVIVGLLLFSLLVFAPYFLRDDLVGYDSYAFLNHVCNESYEHSPLNTNTPIATEILNLIPCNILLIKAILFFLFSSSVLIIAKTGEIVNKENGWLAGLFAFLAFLFVQNFVKFENDVFSLPLIFLSYYFLLKAENEKPIPTWLEKGKILYSKKLWYSLIAFALLGIASLIWGAAGFVIIGMGLLHWRYFLLSIPVIAVYGKDLFAAIAASDIIIENIPVRGMIGLLILNYAFLTPVLLGLTYFLGFMALMNAKFAILVVPLLAVGCVNLFNHPRLKNLKIFFVTLSIVLALGVGFLVFSSAPPSPMDWESIDYALDLHNSTGKPIKNEFWLGYMLQSKGYETDNWGFYDFRWLDDTNGYIVVTDQILQCPFKNFSDLNVYTC